MAVIFEQSPLIKLWAEKELNCQFGECQTIASVSDTINAVVILNNFTVSSLEYSLIVKHKHGLSKELLCSSAGYVFNYLKKRRATSFVSPQNQRSIRILEKGGFTKEGIQRKAADGGGDLIMYGMLKDECRWLR